jgi:RND family efflux transporter MFP subunit
MKKSLSIAAAALLLVLLAAGARYVAQRPEQAGARAAAPASAARGGVAPVVITSVTAQRRDFPLELTANGSVSALNRVEIRPQISAAIVQVHIREGQAVQAGQLLFTLDARSAEVQLAQSRAQLQKDQAALADAERQLARSRELLKQGFVSQGAVDTALATAESQRAVAAADRAAIEAAQVALGYTRILAPSAGRAGAINVYAGSYVTPAGDPLVTITQLDPIAVSFPVPQRHLTDLLASLRDGGGRVTALLPDAAGGSPRELQGRLRFVDSAVDAASGTVQAKAQFDNADQRLWPGAYVNVKLTVRTLKDAILIPQAALIQGAQSRSAYVVGPDGKAQLKPVELLASAGDTAVVSGIAAGQRVVVDGKQNLRPGSPVAEQGAALAEGARRGEGAARSGPGAGGSAPGAPQ